MNYMSGVRANVSVVSDVSEVVDELRDLGILGSRAGLWYRHHRRCRDIGTS